VSKSKGNFLDLRRVMRKYLRGLDVLCFIDMKRKSELLVIENSLVIIISFVLLFAEKNNN